MIKKEHSFDESGIARLRGAQCFSLRFVSKALNFIIHFPRRFTKIMSASSSKKVLIVSPHGKVWTENMATSLFLIRVSCSTDRRMNVYNVNLMLIIRH